MHLCSNHWPKVRNLCSDPGRHKFSTLPLNLFQCCVADEKPEYFNFKIMSNMQIFLSDNSFNRFDCGDDHLQSRALQVVCV